MNDKPQNSNLIQQRRELLAILGQNNGGIFAGQIRRFSHEEHLSSTGSQSLLLPQLRLLPDRLMQRLDGMTFEEGHGSVRVLFQRRPMEIPQLRAAHLGREIRLTQLDGRRRVLKAGAVSHGTIQRRRS